MNLFEQLGLDEPILRAITDMGFETPSEIQQKAIPTLLEDDTDMVALAQTGTGKTAAYIRAYPFAYARTLFANRFRIEKLR